MTFRLAVSPGHRAVWLLAVAVLASVHARPARAQGTLSALETDVDRIARAGRPSVVTVLARSIAAQTGRQGATKERARTRVGSGVAVEAQLILTTASVVYGAERLWIRTTNDLEVPAELAGLDPIFNLALLRVDEIRLPPLKFSTGRPAQEGEWVMAIGTSHNRAVITQSVGTIAYRHREPRLSLIQLTNTVYPGYSGGAVLNAHGQLIGIVQGELGLPAESQGYGGVGRTSFVLPVETVRPVYEALRREGRVRHGFLGVTTRAASVPSDTQEGLDVPLGALVESVQPGGPAERAGIVHGDLIVGFDRERVEYPEQLARWVAATLPGVSVELVWVRGETHNSARVRLSESPDLMPQWALQAFDPDREREPEESVRITDLERQIQRLNRELERLRAEARNDSR